MEQVKRLNKLYKTTSLKRPISKLAHMIAKITLRFNFLVFEFIELYKFHLVRLAKKEYPEYSIVELSARTGLDRRYISESLKKEQLKKTPSKITLILTKIRETCISNHSKSILKHGKDNSFESICLKISSSSLTSNSVATELIRQGEIIDNNNDYKIVNLIDNSAEKSLIFLHEYRSIISDIKRYCNLNNTEYIPKLGKEGSFEHVFKSNKSDLFSINEISQALISKGFIIDHNNQYKLVEWIYLSHHDNINELVDLLAKELERLADTIINNINMPDNQQRCYQRNSYSTKVNPNKHSLLQSEIAEILKIANIEIGMLLDKNDSAVPRNTYPPFGASLFTFW
ncbi:MAG: hypothetical protein JKX98_02225 [Alcanivoracaceae bacterium]|nr:hypothetical protein [Alcanivoracaceae bacterium]